MEPRIKTLKAHLEAPGPKRVLSLDGGGVRGIVAVAFLEHMEDLLKEHYEAGARHALGLDNNFRLCDYFDLIGGTSTGAIIAAGLACGRSMSEIRDFYFSIAKNVFKRSALGLFRPQFRHERLREVLDCEFAGVVMGGPEIKTGLSIFMKNSVTNSPWIISNNPGRKFWHNSSPEKTIHMKDNRLSEVVSGSTAAPFYFDPQKIDITSAGRHFEFIDGGFSAFNIPIIGLLDLATLKAYGLNWQKGAEDLLIISVGTGQFDDPFRNTGWYSQFNAALSIEHVFNLMSDFENFVLRQAILRSRCLTPWYFDRDVGDFGMEDPGQEFTLARYDIVLNEGWIQENTDKRPKTNRIHNFYDMTNPDIMEECYAIAQDAARRQMRPEHFQKRFDP